MSRGVRVVIAAFASLVVAGVVFVVGMRTKSPPVLDAIRRMNRAYWNPRAMQTAGTGGAYASIIRHTGRRSGRTYETPVVAEPTDTGFVVALPYGTRPDWIRNVVASGEATIVRDGVEHHVLDPEIVPAALVEEAFAPGDRRAHRLFGVDECLQVRAITAPAVGAGG